MQAPRRVFDAHFHIGPYGTQAFAERILTPLPETLDHTDGDDGAAYVQRYDLQGGVIVPTYLEDQRAAFAAIQASARAFDAAAVIPLPYPAPVIRPHLCGRHPDRTREDSPTHPEQLAPPSTQNLAQWGWFRATLPPGPLVASARVAPSSNRGS